MLSGHHVNRACGPRPIVIDVTASANDLNLRTLAGNPAGAVDVILTVAPGVRIGGTSSPSLTTGTGWTAGSRLFLTNQGTIIGKGGDANAGDGGHAISLGYDLTIDNGGGLIAGGGGGGGRGASEGNVSPDLGGAGGGGGGGGRGYVAGAAGSGATNYAVPGAAGSAGSESAPGGGGAGGQNGFYGNLAGAGGSGGDLGDAGGTGDYGSSGYYGQAGGAAGKAVALNGYAATFTAGNSSERVKGQVA